MHKKKGNFKLIPLLIVMLFVLVSVGIIFNEKSNNAAKEETIENEEKAVNKTDTSTKSDTIGLDAFDKLEIEHNGELSADEEKATKKRCGQELEDLNLTVTYTKDKEDESKVTKVTLECKPKSNAVKTIANGSTVKIKVSGENINDGTITCKDGKTTNETFTPKDTKKATNIELNIDFYVPKEEDREEGKGYCKNATWKTSYGTIEIGTSGNGYSLTEPYVRTATGSRTITPISETSTDDPNEHMDGYKISGLYPENLAQINTTIAKQSTQEGVPTAVSRDSTSTNYEVSEGTDLASISYSYNEYNSAFEAKAGCSGDSCFGEVGKLKKINDRAYSYKFAEKEVASADAIKPDKISEKISLYCDENLTKDEIKLIEAYNRQTAKKYHEDQHTAELTQYYYDESNTTYFKGVQVFKYKIGKYIYNYSNNQVTEDAGYCLRTCNEVVKVDYGPPVYSRGGMCFEYRIKVSSIVNCEADTSHIKTPKCDQNICLPVPICNGYRVGGTLRSSNGYGSTPDTPTNVPPQSHQGGPNEEFDACVMNCDGGKYTDACSEKCYSEVYENNTSATAKQMGLNTLNNVRTVQLANTNTANLSGMYHYVRGGGVRFNSPGHSTIGGAGYSASAFGTTPGLWYLRANYIVKANSTSGYMVNTNGIIRNPNCTDNCFWSGCESNNTYLDFDCNIQPGAKVTVNYYNADTGATDTVDICTADDLQAKDCEYNEKRYQAAVRACKAATTCANSEATYTIKFKYQEDGTKGTSKKIIEVDTNTNNKTSHINKVVKNDIKPGTILSYGGCYGNVDGKRWYQTEWTTPGTWQENKHQYASYDKPAAGQTGWTYLEGQVCLSPYVYETNKAWANEYLKSFVSDDYSPSFSGKFSKKKYSENAVNSESRLEGYNIYGEATGEGAAGGFGYFGWKFSVSCFYAISNESTNCNTQPCCVGDECPTPTDKCDNPPCDNDTTNYTARSFDDKNPIVNSTQTRVILEDGTLLSNLENLPFNWSKDATMKYFAAGGYDNNPERLLQEIINNAESGQTFSEEQIDYEFIMDTDVINFIRQYNRDHRNYAFDAKVEDPQVSRETGVQYYESKFLDQLETLTLKDGTRVVTPRSQDRGSMRAKNYRAQGSLE